MTSMCIQLIISNIMTLRSYYISALSAVGIISVFSRLETDHNYYYYLCCLPSRVFSCLGHQPYCCLEMEMSSKMRNLEKNYGHFLYKFATDLFCMSQKGTVGPLLVYDHVLIRLRRTMAATRGDRAEMVVQ